MACGTLAAVLLAGLAPLHGDEPGQPGEGAGGVPFAPRARRAPGADAPRPGADGRLPVPPEAGRQPRASAPEKDPIDTSGNKRIVLRVKHTPAHALAQSLERYFTGIAGIHIAGETVSNSLLISAPPEFYEEALKTVALLDRAPHSVAVEVTVVDFPIAANERGAAEAARKPFDPRDFEGPAEKVREKLDELNREGKIQRLKRFRILALENQTTQSQDNEDKPATPPPPPAAFPQAPINRPSVLPRVGTVIQCTSRVTAERGVTMELTIHDFPRPEPLAAGDRNPQDAISYNFLGTLAIPTGKAVVASVIERNPSPPRQSQTLFIVSAQVIAPEPDKPVAVQELRR
jgi:hypothetical protein